jgi:hypothetical protein
LQVSLKLWLVLIFQEIIGNLVTHIGSGFAGEIELSLDILLDLVNNHLQLMAPFAVFIKASVLSISFWITCKPIWD